MMAYFLTVLVLVSLAGASALLALGTVKPGVPQSVSTFVRRLSGQQEGYLRVVAVASVFLAPVWLFVLGGVVAAIWHLFTGKPPDPQNTIAVRLHFLGIGSIVVAFLALIGAPLALIRVWTGERQTRTIEQGHVTDRLTKAIDQLGSEKTVKRTITRDDGTTYVDESTVPNIEVRLGAIYALERIAWDSERDHISVMETLCAYVRENAKAADAMDHDLGEWPDYPVAITNHGLEARLEQLEQRQTAMGDWLKNLPGPRVDIQTALTVIGRRSPNQISLEKERGKRGDGLYRLDLQRTDLRRTNLSHLNLDNANLSNARMEKANLHATSMRGAWLLGTRMEGAGLDNAQVTTANFTGARMEGASFKNARLEGATLSAARLQQVDFCGAGMEDANLSFAKMEAAQPNESHLHRANLSFARMERTNLKRTRLGGVDIGRALLDGSDLRESDLRSAEWGHFRWAALAHAADLRGAIGLTQAQLDRMIGDDRTLLPDGLAPDTREPFSIPSCWPAPGPPFFETMILSLTRPNSRVGRTIDDLSAEFLCPDGAEPDRTGTRLALDAPYPDGDPLADRWD